MRISDWSSDVCSSDLSEKSKALFANLTYEVIPGVRINGGYRYTWDSYESCSGTSDELDPRAGRGPGDCPSGLAAGSQVEGKSKAPTWTIGVDWKASDELDRKRTRLNSSH